MTEAYAKCQQGTGHSRSSNDLPGTEPAQPAKEKVDREADECEAVGKRSDKQKVVPVKREGGKDATWDKRSDKKGCKKTQIAAVARSDDRESWVEDTYREEQHSICGLTPELSGPLPRTA